MLSNTKTNIDNKEISKIIRTKSTTHLYNNKMTRKCSKNNIIKEESIELPKTKAKRFMYGNRVKRFTVRNKKDNIKKRERLDSSRTRNDKMVLNYKGPWLTQCTEIVLDKPTRHKYEPNISSPMKGGGFNIKRRPKISFPVTNISSVQRHKALSSAHSSNRQDEVTSKSNTYTSAGSPKTIHRHKTVNRDVARPISAAINSQVMLMRERIDNIDPKSTRHKFKRLLNDLTDYYRKHLGFDDEIV